MGRMSSQKEAGDISRKCRRPRGILRKNTVTHVRESVGFICGRIIREPTVALREWEALEAQAGHKSISPKSCCHVRPLLSLTSPLFSQTPPWKVQRQQNGEEEGRKARWEKETEADLNWVSHPVINPENLHIPGRAPETWSWRNKQILAQSSISGVSHSWATYIALIDVKEELS